MSEKAKLRPTRDPNCAKYRDDPNRVWYGAEWMTPEQVERRQAREREYVAHRRATDPDFLAHERKRNREKERRNRPLRALDPNWVENARAAWREDARRYRARKRAATVEAIPTAARLIFEGAACFYCPSPGGTVDHFHAIDKGGAHAAWNLLPACRPCNSAKGNRDPIAFLLDRLDEIEEAL